MLTPFIGMPVTVAIGNDRHAGEIIGMSASKHRLEVMVQHLRIIFTRRNNGQYIERGKAYTRLILGEAVNYLDPNF